MLIILINNLIKDLLGVELDISAATNKIIPELKQCQQRLLEPVECEHYSIDNYDRSILFSCLLGCGLWAVGCWLLAVGCWLLAVAD
ncbi:hypothetical protein [Pectobacterium versatile]|uniref:hypothetical protein n=1 Tax=Pectobacterium versatile TaxID=2488639 RepID=UPI001F444EBC|nr:hypothetical protein [Pectobacterium versatile]